MLAFADYFKSCGHDVQVFSNWLEPASSTLTPETFLDATTCGHLTAADVWFLPGLSRTYGSRGAVPEAWNHLDVMIVPYGGYGHLQRHLRCKVIPWVIHPDQQRFTDHAWTNSETTAARLSRGDWRGAAVRVVRPPHSYQVFREYASPWHERQIDVTAIGYMLPSKGLIEFDRMAELLGLRSAIVGASCSATRQASDAIRSQIRHSVLHENVSSLTVASILGRSKIYCSMSREESASLAVYEALNANCAIVALDAGAIREQIGDGSAARVVARDQVEASICSMLAASDPPRTMDRGSEFDRITTGPLAEAALTAEFKQWRGRASR